MSVQEEDKDQNIQPRGEHRQTGVISQNRAPRGSSSPRGDDDGADVVPPPEGAYADYHFYYIEFPFVQAALKIFDEQVMEPGWDVEARKNGEKDEDMTEALRNWGKNCAVYAGEPGHDLIHILSQIPSLRRIKPAVFLEKIGTVENPDDTVAIQMLEPTSITVRLRKNQNIVIQPGDDVSSEHPQTESGEPAAYVQYDEDGRGSASQDEEPVPFSANDLIKVVYDPQEGSPWGRTIWPALEETITGLIQKLADRNAAIRLAGHPHRIYSSDTWSEEEAQSFSEMHQVGDTSTWELDSERRSDGFASRVDFVPNVVNVQVVGGEVADIDDAIKDDIEAIFGMMPVSKFKIAYESDINQFVVQPQENKDQMWIDKERRFLESMVGNPLFSQKADELADGYDGEIDFRIRQPVSDNPLERDDFDAEEVLTLMRAFTEFASSGASVDFPRELPYFAAGMEKDLFEQENVPDSDSSDESDPIDEEDPDVEQAAKELGLIDSE